MIFLAETVFDRETGKKISSKIVEPVDMSFDEYIDTFAEIEARHILEKMKNDGNKENK